jgi:hypothetical protein
MPETDEIESERFRHLQPKRQNKLAFAAARHRVLHQRTMDVVSAWNLCKCGATKKLKLFRCGPLSRRMDLIFNDFLAFIATHLATLAATTLSMLAAALIANFRGQINAAAKWALAPIARRLPWNRKNPINGSTPDHESNLTSELTVVDVLLMSTDGKTARYQKTGNYIVNNDYLNSYQEGVTATGKVGGFSSMLGTIVETTNEHGFYISRIDLVGLLSKGSRFQNVFTADLHDCFTNDEEHWTQEIALPTKHLTFRIHFPKGRPPKRVKCKVVEGVTSKQVRTDAKITGLSGEQGIVWDIQNPKLRDIYKLEWVW